MPFKVAFENAPVNISKNSIWAKLNRYYQSVENVEKVKINYEEGFYEEQFHVTFNKRSEALHCVVVEWCWPGTLTRIKKIVRQ